MNRKNKLGTLAITQSLLLVISIVAIAFMVGSSIDVVSAGGNGLTECTEKVNDKLVNKTAGELCDEGKKICDGKGNCVEKPIDKDTTNAPGNCISSEIYCTEENKGAFSCNSNALSKCVEENGNYLWEAIVNPTICGTCNDCVCSGKTPDPIIQTVDPPSISTIPSGSGDSLQSWLGYGQAATQLYSFGEKALGGSTATTVGGAGEAAASYTPSLGGQTSGFGETFLEGSLEAAKTGNAATETAAKATFWEGGSSVFSGANSGTHIGGTVSTAETAGTTVSSSVGGAFGVFLANYAIALAAAQLYIWVAEALGAGDRNMQGIKTTAYTTAIAAATVASTAVVLFGSAAVTAAVGGPVGWIVAAAVIVITSIYMAFSYQDYSQELFSYRPQVWQPVEGGEDCEQCNDFRYGCSEYQCHALGKSCGIVNKGTEEEKCVWLNENDILPPELRPLESALKSNEYKYIQSDAVLPGETGVKIIYENSNDKCVPAFQSVSFGVETNEPAECMIDLNRKPNMSEMLGHMKEGPVSIYNHTMEIPSAGLPSQEALAESGFNVENGKHHNFFIRCKDTNGNPTVANFLIEFCVEDGPDTMAPIIEGTNYLPETPIAYNVSKAPLEVYTNEPADCRWDFIDLNYEDMQHEMEDCSQNMGDYLKPNLFQYGCKSELTGIKSGQPNDYYIKCEDKPWWTSGDVGKRMSNQQAHILTLIGTEPLIIDTIKINEKENDARIIDSVEPTKITLKVNTLAGANEGNSKCQYGEGNTLYDFYNSGNFIHSYENTQDLYLPSGEYNYTIKCIDEAGNIDTDYAVFEVKTDTTSPVITRVYYEEENLKLKTNEDAVCVYGIESCNYDFDDGAEMSSNNGFDHYTEWNTNFDLFVKCKDLFGNKPLPQDQCSIVLRAVEKEYY